MNTGNVNNFQEKIAVMVLGYGGLPWLSHLAYAYSTYGFDIDEAKIEQFKNASAELVPHKSFCKKKRNSFNYR